MWLRAGQTPPEGGSRRANPKAPVREKSAAPWAGGVRGCGPQEPL